MTNMAARDGGSGNGLHILVLDPLVRSPDQPGPARTVGLAKKLAEAGHRVSVLTTSAGFSGETPPQITGVRIEAVPEQRHRFGYPPATARFTRAMMVRIWGFKDVDLVIAADCPPPALFLAMVFSAWRAAPLLLETRRIPDTETPAHFVQAAAAALGRFAAAAAARAARRIFALSPLIGTHLADARVRSDKIVVSPLTAETPATGDAANPLPVSGRVLLYAGPFTPESGVEWLVQIAQALNTQSDPPRLVLCGDGPSRARLEALARQTGVLEKTLWIAKPLTPSAAIPAFASAGVVLAPAAHASMEIAAAFHDGLAAGKPLAVWGAGPYRELIEARAAGIGLPSDPAAASRELADFLGDADGQRRAGQQALALANGRFSLERIAADIRAAVEDAAQAAPRLTTLRTRMLRGKRLLDMTAAAAGLILLSPVMLIIAAAICLKMGWPPLFAQTRIGLKGEPFRIYKFRTMSNATDNAGAPLPDAERLTPLGKFLRRTSLDELPELINVLIGDMSLVGPRPLLPEYLPHYTAEQRRRHDLRPGITGWSQVNGRNAASWEDRFTLDVWYVDNLSLWLDIKIILKTFWITLTGAGVNAPGHATMPRFDEVVARREGAEDI